MIKFLRKIAFRFRSFLWPVLVVGILVDIFFIKSNSDPVTFFLLFVWILTVLAFNLKGKHSFIAALVLLLLAQVLAIFRVDLTPPVTSLEKTVVWAYLFLAVGVIKQVKELMATKR